jgi:hypothetical protein
MGEKKDLTGIRLRPDQTEALKKMMGQDKEASISSLVRRAIDEFIAKQKGIKKKT